MILHQGRYCRQEVKEKTQNSHQSLGKIVRCGTESTLLLVKYVWPNLAKFDSPSVHSMLRQKIRIINLEGFARSLLSEQPLA